MDGSLRELLEKLIRFTKLLYKSLRILRKLPSDYFEDEFEIDSNEVLRNERFDASRLINQRQDEYLVFYNGIQDNYSNAKIKKLKGNKSFDILIDNEKYELWISGHNMRDFSSHNTTMTFLSIIAQKTPGAIIRYEHFIRIMWNDTIENLGKKTAKDRIHRILHKEIYNMKVDNEIVLKEKIYVRSGIGITIAENIKMLLIPNKLDLKHSIILCR